MPVLIAPETNEAKERVKWEAHPTMMGQGKRPYVYRNLPSWMYKAGRPTNGLGPHCIVDQEIADGDPNFDRLYSNGYRDNPLAAIKVFEDQQLEFAKLAAEMNYEQKHKLSPKASAEVDAARAKHAGHMPTMPETPIKPRRGRKPKES